MRNILPIIIAATLLGACDRQEDARNRSNFPAMEARPSGSPTRDAAKRTDAHWSLQSSAEGTVLVLRMQTGGTILSLSCPSGENRLQVNVPDFTPIGSEERMSFGSGGEHEALVADVRGDRQLGGVSAEGAVPPNLAALMGGPFVASYGSQTSGPHPAAPRDIIGSFIAACGGGTSAGMPRADAPEPSVSPCLVQDSQKLPANSLRAVGTEPFWAARIEGRCVTYSYPEDQQGTRVWTRFTPIPHGGVWTGALGGRQFELRTRAAPGCSDGMSDKGYPLAVEILVNGERRKGCAEPI